MIVKKKRKKKKRTCRILNIAVSADHIVRLKESKKRDRYLYLARELWNIKLTVIRIEISALGTITKGLVKGLEDLKIRVQVETILLHHY